MKSYTIKYLSTEFNKYWFNKFFIKSSMIAFLSFLASLFVNYGAIVYSTKQAGSSTTDILLDNLPVVNTDIVFSEGALLFVIFITILLVLEPKIVPFTLKSIAFFIFIRAIFVSMTHLGIPLGYIETGLNSFKYISSGADLFFSGHTGLPFLMSLLFWKRKLLRWIFLFSSILAATAVIFGHLHYTIDVISAYFITFTIFHLAKKFFPIDYKIFVSGLNIHK